MKLVQGRIYRNRNGSDFVCRAVNENEDALMERVTDGWTLTAHGIAIFSNGTIEWDYSTGGHWGRERRPQ